MAGIHARRVVTIAMAVAIVGTAPVASGQPAPPAQDVATLAEIDRVMENYRLDAHIPGMVWGVVKDGKLVHVKGTGVQDIESKRPVTADSLFLLREGHLKTRPATITSALATAYAAVSTIFTSGSVTSAGDVLSINFLMDRDARHWARDLSALKAEVGTCDTTSAIVPGSALSGDFTWRCEHGRVKGALLLAPTRKPQIQALSVTRVTP
jgi:hypothetical protein